MHKVLLKTEKLELVAEIQIPPFQPHYPILLWGSRFFRYHSRMMKPGGVEVERLTYTEAACYAVVPGSEVQYRITEGDEDGDGTNLPEFKDV